MCTPTHNQHACTHASTPPPHNPQAFPHMFQHPHPHAHSQTAPTHTHTQHRQHTPPHTPDRSISCLRRMRSSLCSVKLATWSRAFLFTWLYAASSPWTFFRAACSSCSTGVWECLGGGERGPGVSLGVVLAHMLPTTPSNCNECCILYALCSPLTHTCMHATRRWSQPTTAPATHTPVHSSLHLPLPLPTLTPLPWYFSNTSALRLPSSLIHEHNNGRMMVVLGEVLG